jgi:phosphoribosylformylglycinamidine cyclo-ligase
MKYFDFVDYSKLDPVKKAAIEKFSGTIDNPKRLGFRVLPETLGESAIAIELQGVDYFLAFNVEGLGTKNMIADAMANDARGKRIKYYENIGIDTVAMSTNDLSSIGAAPLVYGDIISSGDSNWFSEEKSFALLEGYRKAAVELGLAIPCGETPTLKGIVAAETLDLAGSCVGAIKPKNNLTVGQNLKAGDIIFGIESSGVHANGISLCRKIAAELKDGYFTELPDSGKLFGEELLVPTKLYSPLIEELLAKTKINYFSPITGHGWKKIMRAKKTFSYDIDFVPEPSEIFRFLQEKGKLPDNEAYYTWNMGIGYVAIAPKDSTSEIEKACKKFGTKVWELGTLKEGEKRVNILPKNIVFD